MVVLYMIMCTYICMGLLWSFGRRALYHLFEVDKARLQQHKQNISSLNQATIPLPSSSLPPLTWSRGSEGFQEQCIQIPSYVQSVDVVCSLELSNP